MVGPVEAGGIENQVISGHLDDPGGLWLDPPIEALAKRYLLVQKSFQQEGDLCRPFDYAGMETPQLVG